jgi:hypothetical protein
MNVFIAICARVDPDVFLLVNILVQILEQKLEVLACFNAASVGMQIIQRENKNQMMSVLVIMHISE